MNITEEQYLAYEQCRQSGITNMFDTRVVEALTGLSREIILEIMKNYTELNEKYKEEEIEPMTTEEYYTAPSQEIFEDVKEAAIKIWNKYDDTYGYATEKIEGITDLENIKDNAAYIVAMFDPMNKAKLKTLVKRDDTKRYILRLLKH